MLPLFEILQWAILQEVSEFGKPGARPVLGRQQLIIKT
jgi:hypothetical protein